MIRYQPASPGADLMVLAHGAGAGERHPFMVRTARGLADRGIEVVTFDFPYMRERRKVPDKTTALEASFREAIAAARQTAGPAARLFIGGKSMGGRIATHLAAQRLDRLRGVIVFGYPLHPPGRPQQVRTAHLPAIEVPVLILQGERDPFGTPEELRPIIESLRAPVELHVVPGGDHSLAVPKGGGGQARVDEAVLDAVTGWIGALDRS